MARIIYNSKIPRIASLFFPVGAITIGPIIFVRAGSASKTLLNHEKIHIEQGRELYYVGFWALYFYYFLRGVVRFGAYEAYKSIPFEREAYGNQANLNYLSRRPKNNWKTYRI